MSSDSIVTNRRRVEIQNTSEMTPYFIMTKCNKLFITYLTRSTERLPSLRSSISAISTISMTVVRPHKQTSLFHIPARIQYLDLNWSHARGKCAELAFWKFVGV